MEVEREGEFPLDPDALLNPLERSDHGSTVTLREPVVEAGKERDSEAKREAELTVEVMDVSSLSVVLHS